MIEASGQARLAEKTSATGGRPLTAHGRRDCVRVHLVRASPSPGHRQLLESHFTGDELVEGPDHDRLSAPTQLLEPCVLALALERNLRLEGFWIPVRHEASLGTTERPSSTTGNAVVLYPSFSLPEAFPACVPARRRNSPSSSGCARA